MVITVITERQALVTNPLITRPRVDERPATLAVQDRRAMRPKTWIETDPREAFWLLCDNLNDLYPADSFRN